MKLSRMRCSTAGLGWRSDRRRSAAGAMRRATCPVIETLEGRTLLSITMPAASMRPNSVDLKSLDAKIAALAALNLPASAHFHPTLNIDPQAGRNATAAPNPAGITPTQLRNFYGINQVSFNGVTGDGRGQTIAIIDAFDDPGIAADLATFDAAYHLPAPPSFMKVSQTGSTTQLPSPPTPDPQQGSWASEISLDVEWSHVIAPKANILLVETADDSDANLLTGAAYAASVPGVSAVTMSFGDPETNLTAADIAMFDRMLITPQGHPGVTFFASSGDNGAMADGTNVSVAYPASSPNVVSVGGTTFTLNGTGTITGETAWKGSGGGISIFEPQSAAQKNGVGAASGRLVPDVSFDADPNTGVNLCDSFDFGAATPWAVFGGTSLGTPCWAAMTAIVNQGLAASGSPAIAGTPAMDALLYSRPASDFNDITAGNNGNYNAGPGFDLVTGLGTPVANQLLPDLAAAGVAPVVGALSASPTSEPSASSFTLTASKLSDAAGPIASVAFYRESNGSVGLQMGTGGDLPLGLGTNDGHGHWTVTVNTVGLSAGAFTYYVVATDDRGIASAPATAINTIAVAPTPIIHSLTASIAGEKQGTAFTLTANQVGEIGGTIDKVEFYREDNQIAGFQGGSAGDKLLATDTSAAGGWSTSISTVGLDPGLYTYYAVAYDNNGVGSRSAMTTNKVNPLNMIGAVSASRPAESAGVTFNLVASNVAETGATIAKVQFYRESNSAIGPQPGTGADTLLGIGAPTVAGTWTIPVSTAGLAPGIYQYYAIATDSEGLRSSTAGAANTISDAPPVVGSFTVNPPSMAAGGNITLTVSNLASPNVEGAIAGVKFYRESNTNPGLQMASAHGDLLLGAAFRDASGRWNLTVSTTGMHAGTYLYYAVVSDNHGGSTTATAHGTIIGPANDNFANAQVITGLSTTVTGTNENASVEPGEPHHAGNAGGASVWYVWTAPASGVVDVDTNGSNFVTLLAVYLGHSVSSLTPIASSDGDSTAFGYSMVTFKAVAGTQYHIAVDGHNYNDGTGPQQGSITLNLAMPALLNKPANDNFASSQALSGSNITVTGSNVNATRESGEPNHAGNDGGASVWYIWTAATTGTVSLDTHGSSFDTLLAVYTGSSVSQLTSVASNDDTSVTDSTSQLSFHAVAGTKYRIAVDGYNSDIGSGPAEGSIELHLREKAAA